MLSEDRQYPIPVNGQGDYRGKKRFANGDSSVPNKGPLKIRAVISRE